jgi:hypothetical protein
MRKHSLTGSNSGELLSETTVPEELSVKRNSGGRVSGEPPKFKNLKSLSER